MANLKNIDTKSSSPKTEATNVVTLALDAAERGQATAVAVLQDVRIELRTAVDGTIDLGEKLAAGAVRFARKLAQKLDETTADALKGSERALVEAIGNARETARAGKQLAERAVDKVTEKVTARASA
jgi:hypothetical protein